MKHIHTQQQSGHNKCLVARPQRRSMLPLLLSLLLAMPFAAQAQEIFESSGLFGIKQEDGSVWVPAVHTQILTTNLGDFVLVRSAQVGGTVKPPHTAAEVPGLFDDRADTVPAFPFKDNFLYGFASISGNVPAYIPAQYKAMYLRSEYDDYIQLYDGKTFRMYLLWKNKMQKLWSEVRMENINLGNTESNIVYKQKGFYGLATSYFKPQGKPQYTSMTRINSIYDSFVLLKNDKGYAVAGPEGGLCWQKTPVQAFVLLGNSSMAAVKENGLWGILAPNECFGDEKSYYLSPQFDAVEVANPAEENIYVMVQAKGKWGLFAVGGDSLVLPTEYDRILYKGNGLFSITKDGKTAEWPE